ncbi:MAG: hypothetical protein IID42_11410 [Planctomycetes bacterium]|nr:hypothetical protein [Planctomycetota bacterium]
MMNSRDPVEQALAALKSERRRVGGSKQELEKRLMEQFGTSGTASRFTKYRTLLVALGVILVGGAGFAATDAGSSVLKNIFVRISIDGEISEVELAVIDGEATWTTENEDGGTTTIKLFQLDEPEGEGFQTVEVEIEADGAGDKTIELLLGGLPADGTIFIGKDGAAAALGGVGCGTFLVEEQLGDGVQETITVTKQCTKGADGGETVEVIEIIGDPGDDHERRRKLIDALISQEGGDAVNVEVQLGEDGIATITLTYEDGTENVLTLDVSGETEDGELTVTVDDDGETIQNPPAESDE